jgi:hypothetical protein
MLIYTTNIFYHFVRYYFSIDSAIFDKIFTFSEKFGSTLANYYESFTAYFRCSTAYENYFRLK